MLFYVFFKMCVTEHTLHVGQAVDEHKKHCSAYYTNNGPVTEKKSHSQMNMNSAMQSYVITDHLNKKERRERRRMMRNSLSVLSTGISYAVNATCFFYLCGCSN